MALEVDHLQSNSRSIATISIISAMKAELFPTLFSPQHKRLFLTTMIDENILEVTSKSSTSSISIDATATTIGEQS